MQEGKGVLYNPLLKYFPHVSAQDNELMFSFSSILKSLILGSFRINKIMWEP
jgi:hypothetical protein